MAQLDVYRNCAQCSGTGTQPGGGGPGASGPTTCTWPGCNGTGKYVIGYVEIDPSTVDLQDKHQDILDKLDDVLEAIQNP